MIKKRFFDILFSLVSLLIILPFLLILIIIATIDTNSFGLFFQERVGQYGHVFWIYKIKTFKNNHTTKLGVFFRKYKIDELPQLLNIFFGNMSFVGPRPDIIGFYDKLEGENRKILELKPGLTCPASLKYFNEEELLSKQVNPMKFNQEVIFPDKIKMNLDYYNNRNFLSDLLILWKTIYK
jgi:lipopolysaccharide/colanic/teichoic acid biosynthesis glycosyltransferase